MTPYEQLARQILRDYTLSYDEREDETRRLAEQVQSVVGEYLEGLEHRRKV